MKLKAILFNAALTTLVICSADTTTASQVSEPSATPTWQEAPQVKRITIIIQHETTKRTKSDNAAPSAQGTNTWTHSFSEQTFPFLSKLLGIRSEAFIEYASENRNMVITIAPYNEDSIETLKALVPVLEENRNYDYDEVYKTINGLSLGAIIRLFEATTWGSPLYETVSGILSTKLVEECREDKKLNTEKLLSILLRKYPSLNQVSEQEKDSHCTFAQIIFEKTFERAFYLGCRTPTNKKLHNAYVRLFPENYPTQNLFCHDSEEEAQNIIDKFIWQSRTQSSSFFTRIQNLFDKYPWAKYTTYALAGAAAIYGGYRWYKYADLGKYFTTRRLAQLVGVKA